MNRYPNTLAARLDNDSYLAARDLRARTKSNSWGELLRVMFSDGAIRQATISALNGGGPDPEEQP